QYTTALTTTIRVEQNDPSALYAGNWYPNSMAVHSGGSATLAMDTNSRITFTFTGIGATWLGYKDPWSGIANVYVDGLPAGSVDTYSPTSKARQRLFTVTGLAQGTHTVTVVVTGTRSANSAGSWIWIDGFEYITIP